MAKKYKTNIDLAKRDRAKYFLPEGDEGYVKKHNDFVINDAIKKYDAMQREKLRTAVEGYGERADAVVHYLKAIDRGKEKNVNRYFGKKYLAYLRGEEIRQQLMSGLTTLSKGRKKPSA